MSRPEHNPKGATSFYNKKEALKYAASMGTTDTIRGIGQLFGEAFGIDELNEYLKEKDKELNLKVDSALLYANEYKVDLIDRIAQVEEKINEA